MSRIAELLATGAPSGPVLLAARDGRTLSREDLRSTADLWGEALDDAAVGPGGRVALAVDDPTAFAAAHLAVLATGRVSVPLDPGTPAAGLRAALARTRASVLVADAAVAARAPDLTVTPVGTAGLPLGPVRPLPGAPPARAAGAATLLGTSGSTGEPKGVLLTEDRLVHVARAVAAHLELGPDDRGLCPLPLFHVNAQVVGLLATLVSGGSLVLDGRFRRGGFWELAREHDVSWINAVPAILTVLTRTGDRPVPPARLRLIRSASAPLPAAVRAEIEARTGVPVVESYGMTEAASQITAVPLHGSAPTGSAGRPCGAEVAVRDADRRDVPAGTRGRVWIRGAGVVDHYEDGRAPERFHGGWLDTGDLGHLDGAGFLHLAGRDDDVINRGGELLHPREIEEVLLADARVAEAVVVGRPDEVLGAVPVACVRAAEGVVDTSGLVAELVERCRAHLSRWKCPADVVVLPDLPRGATGKVRRADLRVLVGP